MVQVGDGDGLRGDPHGALPGGELVAGVDVEAGRLAGARGADQDDAALRLKVLLNKIRNSLVANRSVFKLFSTEKSNHFPLF